MTEQMIRDRRLGHRDLRVLLALLLHCDASGRCWPKRESISDMTGLEPNRVTKVTTRLAELGWIEKSHPGGRGSTAGYQIHRSVTLADSATLNPVTLADSATLEDPVTLADSATLNPVTLADSATLNPVTLADSATSDLPKSGGGSESYPQALLFLRDKENTENTEKKKNTKKKKVDDPCEQQPQPQRRGKTYAQHHPALFEQAWDLAREVNRVTPSRCCRKTSMARWSAKCQDLDTAKLCVECWELEVNSRRVDSGLPFQRGFQVFLNAEPWTDPHALDDLRAAKHNAENGNEHTNGNGNTARPRNQAERYHDNMAQARSDLGLPDPESFRVQGLDDDFEEFNGRNEFQGRTFDG